MIGLIVIVLIVVVLVEIVLVVNSLVVGVHNGNRTWVDKRGQA